MLIFLNSHFFWVEKSMFPTMSKTAKFDKKDRILGVKKIKQKFCSSISWTCAIVQYGPTMIDLFHREIVT
jgi:hypothetical protein